MIKLLDFSGGLLMVSSDGMALHVKEPWAPAMSTSRYPIYTGAKMHHSSNTTEIEANPADSPGKTRGYAWVFAMLIVPASMIFFAPMLWQPAHTIPGTFADAWQTVWNGWWIQQWWQGAYPDLYHTPLLYHPHGASLYLHSLAEGILLITTMVAGSGSPEGLFTIACFVTYLLNGLAASLFFKEFTSKWWVAGFFGALFAFHPYFIGHLQGGHLHLLSLYTPLLFLTAVVRAGKGTLTLPFGVCAGLAFGLGVFNDLYGIYFAALALGMIIPATLLLKLWPVRRLLLQVFLVGSLSVVIMAPKVFTMYSQMKSGEYAKDHSPSRYSTALSSYVIPGPTQSISKLLPPELLRTRNSVNDSESGAYIGIMILGLALLSLRPRADSVWKLSAVFVATGLGFVLLSLGPAISSIQGTALGSNIVHRLLNSFLPAFPSVPVRFSSVAALFFSLRQSSLLIDTPQRHHAVRAGTWHFSSLGLWWLSICLANYKPHRPYPRQRLNDWLSARR